jgi:streptogramin lyase
VPTPNSRLWWITPGPDGALWFTEYAANNIGRITTSGAVTEYPVPTANPQLTYITTGPDGALWFTENLADKIGRITTAGAVTEYPVPTAGANPYAIITGPDGALWFTEQYAGKIGRITTSGAITEFSTGGDWPFGMTTGPDRALWFTLYNSGAIGRAPACALGLTASFADRTLTTNFNLGVALPAIWVVAAGTTDLVKENTPPVAPPRAFSVNFEPFPNDGNVTVSSTLSTGLGRTLCAEWTTVNTAR